MILSVNFPTFLSFLIFIVINQNQVASITENYVIVAGGRNTHGMPISDVQAYRVETGQWIHGDQLEQTKAYIFRRYFSAADANFQILETGKSLTKIAGRKDNFQYQIVDWRSNKNIRRVISTPYESNFREGACGVVHKGTVYLIGGLNAETTISKLGDDAHWIDLTDRLPSPRFHCGAASFEDDIYVCGNQYRLNVFMAKLDAAKHCFKYNVPTNQIEFMNNMNQPRAGSFLVQHGTYLYAVGGGHGQSAERCNLAPGSAQKWELIDSAKSWRRIYSMAVSDGYQRIYLMGGKDVYSTGITEDMVEIYDIEKKHWLQTARMPLAVSAAGVLHVSFSDA